MRADELIRQGRRDEVWTKYCGFLDLHLDEFMAIQRRLLVEQVDFLSRSNCAISRRFLADQKIQTLDDFREIVPITTYEDYEEFLDNQREDVLPRKPVAWAHTSGRSGRMKWVPYTQEAYNSLGQRVLGGVILSSARGRGDVRLELGDNLVYNSPPRPFISGLSLMAMAEQFSFNFVPPLDETETMEFQERIARGFKVGMVKGIDYLGSIAVVLVKIGEQFAAGAQGSKLSAQMLHPKVMFRLLRGYLRSKMEGRPMLPKDLWRVKAIPTGGMDSTIYRDKIEYYWGMAPAEQYGSTEEGAIATQTWNKKGMTFVPDAAFLEFIPEEEWAEWRRDPSYVPRTVLFDEVEKGKRYELVISNFFGKPLVRYRMHDIVQFTELEDSETGVLLPQMQFVGRSSAFIDLAGYTGLIDEKLVWQSIVESNIEFEERAVQKEVVDGKVRLRLFIEAKNHHDEHEICHLVNERLKQGNRYYADYERLLEEKPLLVTMLNPGTYKEYMAEKQRQGADLAHLKPPHMNPTEDDVRLLVTKSAERGRVPVEKI